MNTGEQIRLREFAEWRAEFGALLPVDEMLAAKLRQPAPPFAPESIA